MSMNCDDRGRIVERRTYLTRWTGYDTVRDTHNYEAKFVCDRCVKQAGSGWTVHKFDKPVKHKETCKKCDGSGRFKGYKCMSCDGTGTVERCLQQCRCEGPEQWKDGIVKDGPVLYFKGDFKEFRDKTGRTLGRPDCFKRRQFCRNQSATVSIMLLHLYIATSKGLL